MNDFLGGADILAWLVLALGAAMAVGNIAALVKPPGKHRDNDLPSAPKARSIAYAVIGIIASIWALATLVSSS